jgi:hypothetical protein
VYYVVNLTSRQNIRDHFGESELIYTNLAERVAMDIVISAAKLIRKKAQATAKELVIELVTGKPLLAKRGKIT